MWLHGAKPSRKLVFMPNVKVQYVMVVHAKPSRKLVFMPNVKVQYVMVVQYTWLYKIQWCMVGI